MKKAFFAGCLAAALLLGLAPLLLQSASAELADSTAVSAPEALDGLPETEPATEAAGLWDAAQTVTVRMDGALETMTMADYLEGVVLGEMPASFPLAALEAQAVAARTFTLRRRLAPKHDDADVCADGSCCQQYLTAEEAQARLGNDWEAAAAQVRAAVEATDGLVLVYDGALIDAVYFSCSGGRTEDAAAVWGGEVPYLQSVESPGEETAAPYQDTVSVPLETFRSAILEQAPTADLSENPAAWFGGVTYTEGGGVATMRIGGESFTGTELRTMFGLRSAQFAVAVEADAIVFETRGYGHRVGMSQYGAKAMAEAGADFREILTHYYTGVELVPAAALTAQP